VSKLPCGHPLAARAIRAVDGDLVTVCWACEVAQEIVAASRTRYNTHEGSGLESNKVSPDARLSATTREAGVVASIEVVAR
jgi:hypothetical protein